MIEKMAKLSLLFHHSNKDAFLAELQRLGVFHIENFGVNQTAEITALGARIGRLAQTERFLRSEARSRADAEELPETEDELVALVGELRESLERSEGERERIAAELKRALRWGSFDPAKVAELESAGLGMRLYSSARSSVDRVKAKLAADDSYAFEEVLEELGTVYFVVVFRLEAGIPDIDAAEQRLPSASVESLRASEAARAAEAAKLREAVGRLAKRADFLAERVRVHQNRLAVLLAEASLTGEADGHVFVVSGWVPKRQLPGVEKFLDGQEVLYVARSPEREEKVPILLKNRPYSRLFEPVMRIFSLPNYKELDTTPFLAPFYTIFFGLCVADMAYGLILLAALFGALVVIKRKSARPLLYLGLMLAASVTLMGLFLNSFGGISVTSLFGEHSALADMVLFRDMNGAMFLAVALGVIQVTFGHVLRIFNEVKEHGPSGALGPTGIALLFLGGIVFLLELLGPGFKIGLFPVGSLGSAIPHPGDVALALAGLGLVLALFFGHPRSKVYVRPGLGLWELYELATGTIGDVLSYLRLFALGLAGGLLGEAMVKVALLVKGTAWWGYILMIIVLLLGSGINLAIGLLSAFVHSLRLTFVEFYKAIGFKGGGAEYSPFKLK